MQINNFKHAEALLKSFVPPLRKFRSVYTLDIMRALMKALGNPQESYRTIHVAGTSGKTSTAYYAAEMLRLSGHKVGLTISPHVTSPNERVQIQGAPLDEAQFCKELGIFLDEVEGTSQKPTYFELLVAFAYWEFARQKIDYAVVEVGLGGLIDGTNVISRSDKVCVITDIGLDHTQVLGNTLGEIAYQKAGIMQPSNHAFCFAQTKGVDKTIQEYAKQQQAILHVISPESISSSDIQLAGFQRRNWFLASQAVEYALESDSQEPLTNQAKVQSMKVMIPGRLETLQVNGHVLILDGAHNTQKISAFVDVLCQQYPHQSKAAVVALLQGPEIKYDSILQHLTKVFDRLIFTSFDNQQDLRKIATKPDRLLKKVTARGYSNAVVIEDPKMAFEQLCSGQEEVFVVVGSFYLLYEVRQLVV